MCRTNNVLLFFFFFFFFIRWFDIFARTSREICVYKMDAICCYKIQRRIFHASSLSVRWRWVFFVTSWYIAQVTTVITIITLINRNTLNGLSNNIKSNLSILFYYIVKYFRKGLEIEIRNIENWKIGDYNLIIIFSIYKVKLLFKLLKFKVSLHNYISSN